MAAIRHETERHDWRRRLIQGAGPALGRNLVPGWVCWNCRAYRYGDDADLPVTGCLAGIKVAGVGPARMRDYMEQECRRRALREATEEDLSAFQERGGTRAWRGG